MKDGDTGESPLKVSSNFSTQENRLKVSRNLQQKETSIHYPFVISSDSVLKDFQYEGIVLDGIQEVEGRISNFWHYSNNPNLVLEEGKIYEPYHKANKYGAGFYIGSGNINGDRIKELRSDGSNKYNIELHGKFLLVNFNNIVNSDILMVDVWGYEVGNRGLRKLNDVLREKGFDGMILFDESSAEGVIFQPTNDNMILNKQ